MFVILAKNLKSVEGGQVSIFFTLSTPQAIYFAIIYKSQNSSLLKGLSHELKSDLVAFGLNFNCSVVVPLIKWSLTPNNKLQFFFKIADSLYPELEALNIRFSAVDLRLLSLKGYKTLRFKLSLFNVFSIFGGICPFLLCWYKDLRFI